MKKPTTDILHVAANAGRAACNYYSLKHVLSGRAVDRPAEFSNGRRGPPRPNSAALVFVIFAGGQSSAVPLRESPAHHFAEFVHGKWHGEKRGRKSCFVRNSRAGGENDGRRRVNFRKGPGHVVAAPSPLFNIAQQQIDLWVGERELQRLLAACGAEHSIAGPAQDHFEHLAERFVLIENEHGFSSGGWDGALERLWFHMGNHSYGIQRAAATREAGQSEPSSEQQRRTRWLRHVENGGDHVGGDELSKFG